MLLMRKATYLSAAAHQLRLIPYDNSTQEQTMVKTTCEIHFFPTNRTGRTTFSAQSTAANKDTQAEGKYKQTAYDVVAVVAAVCRYSGFRWNLIVTNSLCWSTAGLPSQWSDDSINDVGKVVRAGVVAFVWGIEGLLPQLGRPWEDFP